MGKQKAKTMSKGQSSTQSGRKILERCTAKGKSKNVVLVDVDNSQSPDVIIIDIPESSQKRIRVPRSLPQTVPSSSFISIDDDEIKVDETCKNGDESVVKQDHDATSSKTSCPGHNQSKNSDQPDCDDCQIIREKEFPLTPSKRKRTYSGNRFGLGPLYDGSSSESDSSDCELMEGPSGKLREQWERAALKRKRFDDLQNGQPAFDDQGSESVSLGEIPENVEVEIPNEHLEVPFCSTSAGTHEEQPHSSSSINSRNDVVQGEPSYKTQNEPVADLGKTVYEDNLSGCKTPLQEEQQFSFEQNKEKTFLSEPLFSDTDMQGDTVDTTFVPSRQSKEEQIPGGPSFWSTYQKSEKSRSCDETLFQHKDESVHLQPCRFNSESRYETDVNHDNATFDDEVSHQNRVKSNETYTNPEGVIPRDKDAWIHKKSTFIHTESPASRNSERDCLKYGEPSTSEPSLSSKQSCGQTQIHDDINFMEKDGLVPDGSFSCKTQLLSQNEVICESVSSQDKEKPPTMQDEQDPAPESLYDTEQVTRIPLHVRDDNITNDSQNNIIGIREKHKETVEYKRAEVEEWASRKLQLQIQAEEAQRLRKRKKAEAQRLLDMERRQKQRVEEMRETQKKSVETINMKEQLRAEVLKELHKLELMHIDMASLLRGLGIPVGGGLYPTSREVHAAYKQALLRFHPDRASRADIRQQVEAEEKFKLISRLKEKLLPAS